MRKDIKMLLTVVVTVLLCTTGLTRGEVGEEDDYDDSGRPWLNPVQELQGITHECSSKSGDFMEMANREQKAWQNCMDKITFEVTNDYPVLERDSKVEDDKTINSSVIYEIDRKLHMVICSDTDLYKSCWSGVIRAINYCKPGSGDVSGKIYFALYDDICRDGGRITVENRRKSALAGSLCARNYSIPACHENDKMHSNDICERFQANAACDLGSIDPNCQNLEDKRLHPEIFQRVGQVLKCAQMQPTNGPPSNEKSYTSSANNAQLSVITIFTTILVLVTII